MNREDQNFDQLRRLLKLKRYEQPPPRYFNDFSGQVVARLRTTQASPGNSWWQRVWSGLELRPALPVALSAAVCGLLVFGAVYSETPAASEVLGPQAREQVQEKSQPAGGLAVLAGMIDAARPVGLPISSTNPMPAGETLFDRFEPLQTWRTGHPMFE